jgi:hypothetical protein
MERLQRDKGEADQQVALLRKDLQAVQAKKRNIDASFEKLDRARERTRTALQHSRSLHGRLSTPGSEAGDASRPEPSHAEELRSPAELLQRSKSSAHSGPYQSELEAGAPALRPSAVTVRPGWSGRMG